MPMTNQGDATQTLPRRIDFQASPSLACDLCWVLSVAGDPTSVKKQQIRGEVFSGREELAERVRTFWGDGMENTCFTEMQALAHHGGAIAETSPTALWAAIVRAV